MDEIADRDYRVGHRLRARRRALNLTLDEVAKGASLTKGFVSAIERELTSPSVASLLALCKVLRISVGSLFDTPKTTLVRRQDRAPIEFGGVDVDDYLLTPSAGSSIQVIFSRMGPRASGGEELYAVQAETEFVFVLKGRVRMNVNHEITILHEGDALTFDPKLPHTFSNDDSSESVALFVLTPPVS